MAQTFKQKLVALFTSLRFWIVTLTLILSILQSIATGTLDTVTLLSDVQVWLGVVVGLGTLDAVAGKVGSAIGLALGGATPSKKK